MARSELEQRLRDQPRDDASWQVYGDWLLEQGDARGELIRLEHRLSTSASDSAALRKSITELEAQHRASWLGPAPAEASIVWQHGFIAGIELPYAEETAGVLEALLASEEARFLSSLTLSPPGDDDAIDDEDFDDEDFDEDEDENENEDNLGRAPTPVPAPAVALAQLQLDRLRTLALPYCVIGVDGAAALSAIPTLAHLTALDLRFNGIGDEGIAALLQPQRFALLQSLNLSRNRLTHAGATTLANATFPHLQHLDLRYNPIRARGAQALAASSVVSQLQTLLLYRDDITDDGAHALAASPHLPLPLRRFWNTP